MSDEKALHQGYLLHVTAQEYILHPGDPGRALVFDRSTGDLRLNPVGASVEHLESQGRPIFGLMGIISFPNTDLLVLITSAKLRGKLFGHPVYLASRFLLLPITTKETLDPLEGRLISLVYRHLEEGKFWFSYELDLTRSLQAQAVALSQSGGGMDMWELADDRFFWNKYLQSRLIRHLKATGEKELGRFILPVLYGSFDLRSTAIQSHEVQFAVISRRARFRAGTRYNTRGVDAQGNPGNFNETEQILIVPSSTNEKPQQPRIASFVQTRGSAPFYWAEIVNLVFIPDLIVMDRGDESRRAFHAHIDAQKVKYGKVLLMNLVKGRGREKHIKDAYESMVQDGDGKAHEGVEYTHFDLHSETAGGKWHRVDEKTAQFAEKLQEYGYFEADFETLSAPSKTQQGVVRTNCMDCLDRTNLMQTSLAKHVINLQLHDFGLLDTEHSVKDEDAFMVVFRDVWSDHGNFIAKAYTGTSALRTDFTRTGVRTKKGVVFDKFTSLWRYIMNNHMDGYKQDAFDLMTGTWVARRDPAYVAMLLRDKRHWAVRLMPYILAFALFMVLATLILPRTSAYPLPYPLGLWLSMFIISGTYIVHHPNDYIAWPRLNFQPTLDAINYSGPGARTDKRAKAQAAHVVLEKGEKTIVADVLKGE